MSLSFLGESWLPKKVIPDSGATDIIINADSPTLPSCVLDQAVPSEVTLRTAGGVEEALVLPFLVRITLAAGTPAEFVTPPLRVLLGASVSSLVAGSVLPYSTEGNNLPGCDGCTQAFELPLQLGASVEAHVVSAMAADTSSVRDMEHEGPAAQLAGDAALDAGLKELLPDLDYGGDTPAAGTPAAEPAEPPPRLHGTPASPPPGGNAGGEPGCRLDTPERLRRQAARNAARNAMAPGAAAGQAGGSVPAVQQCARIPPGPDGQAPQQQRPPVDPELTILNPALLTDEELEMYYGGLPPRTQMAVEALQLSAQEERLRASEARDKQEEQLREAAAKRRRTALVVTT